MLLRRDPWLVSQTLMQMLYLVPPAVLLWRSFAARRRRVQPARAGAGHGGRTACRRPRLAHDLGRGRARPRRRRAGSARLILRAKIEAVLGIIALVFAPLVAVLAVASPWHALVTSGGIVIAAASATAIQLWFRSQAKRSQFRRRQVSSRVATFAEAFSSIAWAATAAVAAINLWLAIGPALIALLVLAGGARYLESAQKATRAPCDYRAATSKNDDLAHLFERAEHVAGLTADLPQAQPRHQRDDDREHDHRRDRMRETKAGDQRENSQGGGDGGTRRLRLADVEREPIAARRRQRKTSSTGMVARAARCAAIKAAATSPGSSRLASALARNRIDSASAQTP